MTDSEKLNMILEKITGLDEKVTGLDEKVTGLDTRVMRLEKDMVDVKADIRQLCRNDDFILDEVERVHEILLTHMKDKEKHTA